VKKKSGLVALCVLFVLAGTATGAEQLTYVDLVRDLTNLEQLAVLPEPGEQCAQWSSYDRHSTYNEESGKYVNWSANGDGGCFIRTEGDMCVLAEMEGPGCIRRIWSAAPGSGRVKIYLDGASEPAVDLPFSGYFDLKNQPFVYPSLVHTPASGKNCYVPIPYQKACKIVAEKNWGNYYHFTYQTFPKGTIVPTFERELSPGEKAALEAADVFLRNRMGMDPAGRREGETTEVKRVAVPPERTVAVAERVGYCVQPQIYREPGAFEGEGLKILQKSAGDARPQELLQFGANKWSGDAQLWWTGAKPGDTLVLAIPVAQAGKYELQVQLTRARDYGIVQLCLDEEKLGEPSDLYNPAVVPTGIMRFGMHELDKGEHRLSIEIVGANDKAVKAYMFGLDYVKLVKK